MDLNPDNWEDSDGDLDLGLPDAEQWKEYIYPSSHELNQEDQKLNNNDHENDGN